MLKALAACVALLASVAAQAEPASLAFAGDRYVRKHEQGNARASIIEFVPGDESIDGWTRLVGFHGLWDNDSTAAQAAATLARLTEQRYPNAKPRVRSKGAEALVDFVVAPLGGDLVEFNVFKYGRGPGGRGIVAFQFAHRFRGLDPDDVRVLCARWVAEAARFDLKAVGAALTAKARFSLASAAEPPRTTGLSVRPGP